MQRKETILVVSLVAVVLTGTFALMVSTGKSSSAKSDICSGKSGFSLMVDIHDSKVSNPNITAKLCDKIMFKNSDPVIREVAFGPHEDHVPYDGVGEKVLNQDDSFTITLNQTGKFHWHDHIHDDAGGYFTVTK